MAVGRARPVTPFEMQVMRVLLPIGIKAVLDGSFDRELERDRNRAAVLESRQCRWRLTVGLSRSAEIG